MISVATRYLLFAIIATSCNLGAQEITLFFYAGPYSILLSIFNGTIVGLVSKYVLDKRFIFRHFTKTKLEDARLFILYSSTGVLTTLIFWGSELLFHWVFGEKWLRYLGAILGLALGYTIKFHLDKRLVFRS